VVKAIDTVGMTDMIHQSGTVIFSFAGGKRYEKL